MTDTPPGRRADGRLVSLTDDIDPRALLTVKQVAARLNLSEKQVYALFDEGVLLGPRRKPRRVFGLSVIDYLNDTNVSPARAEPTPEPEQDEATPLRRPAPKTPSQAGSRVALPHPGRTR